MSIATHNSPLFAPFTLGGLRLRNRIFRAGCFEGMSPEGKVTDRLLEHHRQVAAGGVALTTVSYCSVSRDGRAFAHELWMRPEIVPDLKRLTAQVHREGAAACIQLGHCGYFSSPRVIGGRPLGASPKVCLFRLSLCRQMTKADIAEKTADFVRAARLAREAGFDAVEIHAGHGYLLSQFLSPWTNRRSDEYGGTLENRLRFPVQVISQVRAELGPDFPVLVKMNQRDGVRGGLELEEAVKIAQAFAEAGATALVPSCGFTSGAPLYMLRGARPVGEMVRVQKNLLHKLGLAVFGRTMVRRYPFTPLFLLEGARRIRDACPIPVGYVGGARSREEMENLISEGFAFVQLGRPTIRDPDFVRRLETGEIDGSDCDQCNRCVAVMSVEGVRCVSRGDDQQSDTGERRVSRRGLFPNRSGTR